MLRHFLYFIGAIIVAAVPWAIENAVWERVFGNNFTAHVQIGPFHPAPPPDTFVTDVNTTPAAEEDQDNTSNSAFFAAVGRIIERSTSPQEIENIDRLILAYQVDFGRQSMQRLHDSATSLLSEDGNNLNLNTYRPIRNSASYASHPPFTYRFAQVELINSRSSHIENISIISYRGAIFEISGHNTNLIQYSPNGSINVSALAPGERINIRIWLSNFNSFNDYRTNISISSSVGSPRIVNAEAPRAIGGGATFYPKFEDIWFFVIFIIITVSLLYFSISWEFYKSKIFENRDYYLQQREEYLKEANRRIIEKKASKAAKQKLNGDVED